MLNAKKRAHGISQESVGSVVKESVLIVEIILFLIGSQDVGPVEAKEIH